MLCRVGLVKRFSSTAAEKLSAGLLRQFINRTKAANKIRNLIMQDPWSTDIIDVLNKINVKLSAFVVCEVVGQPTPIDNALNFFNWWKSQPYYEPSDYAYNAILARLGNAQRYDEMDLLLDACKSDGKLNVFILTNVMARHRRTGNIDGALQVWNEMKQLGIRPNTATYTVMIDLFAQEKQFKKAREYFIQMVQEECFPNVNTCTVLIYHLAQAGQLNAARMIMNEMVKIRIKPNCITYSILIREYAKTKNTEMVLELASEMIEYGLRPTLLGKEFYKFLKESLGRVEDAEKVIEKLCYQLPAEEQKGRLLELQAARDLDSENEGEVLHISTVDARSMDSSLKHWNRDSFAKALNPWTSSTASVLNRAQIYWNGKLVLDILKRLRDAGVAWNFFDWVGRRPEFKHDYYTYTRMVHLYLGARKHMAAKRLVEEAQRQGVVLSVSTYNRIIKCYGLARDFCGAMEMAEHLKRLGLKPNASTFTNLIHVLAKSKCCQSTKRLLFKLMEYGFKPDVEAYNTLIFSFGVAGHVKMVYWLLQNMSLSHLEPNEKTYTALIIMCYKYKNYSLAEQLFRKMKEACLRPTQTIYSLMVKIFLGFGKVVEAKKLSEESKAVTTVKAPRKSNFQIYLSIQDLFIKSMIKDQNLECIT